MHKKILTYICFLIVPFVHFPEVFLSNFQFGHPDHLGFLLPIKNFFFSNLKNGDLTWFYPYHLMGVPLSLGPHYQIIYPINFLWLLFDNPNLSYKLQYLLSYFLFQTFFFHFLKSLTHSVRISFMSTILLVSSPIIWSTHLRPLELDSLSFIPLSLWMTINFLQTKRVLFAISSGIAIFIIYLSGDPISCLYTLAFNFILYFASPLQKQELSLFSPSKKIAGILITTIITISLIAPFFLESYTWLSLTERNQHFSFQEKFLYSSHPSRILEIIFPISSLIWDQNNSSYSDPSWWYEKIGFGIFFISTILFGLAYKSNHFRNLSLIFTLSSLLIFYVSYGKHFSLSIYIWDHIAPFNFMRFPERILKHSVLPLGICYGIGLYSFSNFLKNHSKLKHHHQNILLVLFFLTLFEMQSGIPNQNNTKPQVLQEYPEELPKLGISDRLHVCVKNIGSFVSEKELFPLFEPRMWKIPQLIASEASFPLTAKQIDCNHSLSEQSFHWLGITHILTPWFDSPIINEIESNFKIKRISESKNLNYILFKTKVEKSYQAIPFDKVNIGKIIMFDSKAHTPAIDPYWYINEHGSIKKSEHLVEEINNRYRSIQDCKNVGSTKPITTQSKFLNKISIEYQNQCPSLLLIPITFAPGWKASTNNRSSRIYRLNDWVIGIFTENGQNSIQLEYFKP